MPAGLTGINHFFDIAHLIMAPEFVALDMRQTSTVSQALNFTTGNWQIFQRKYHNEELAILI